MVQGTKQIHISQLQELPMRDPYIFADPRDNTYYLFGTTRVCNGAADIDPFFEVWRSKDLKYFEGPYVAFAPPDGYWGIRDYWAPEVHEYQGAYYLLGSFKGAIGEHRGTAIVKAEHPGGPYVPHSAKMLTPPDQEALDGTLFVDREGQPWLVYCREWTSLFYGQINAVPLTEDLRCALPEKTKTIVDTKTDPLPWIRKMYDPRVEKSGYLTDAPFLHQNPDGSILMLWSSYAIADWAGTGQGGYTVAQVHNPSGSMQGDWHHLPRLLLDENAGHPSIFQDFEGNLRLVCHCNDTKHDFEYPILYTLQQKRDGLEIKR